MNTDRHRFGGERDGTVRIVQWLKRDGDCVEVGEPICEISTVNAYVEIPSPEAGRMFHLKQEGDEVAVGEKLARFEP